MEKEKARQIDGLANPELILPENYKELIKQRRRDARINRLKEALNFAYEVVIRLLVFAVGYILAKRILLSLQG